MLISEEYKNQISEMHRENPDWGTSGRRYAGIIERMIGDFSPLNILDYGCGKQTLARMLPKYRIRGYDPGLPGLDTPPEPHDLVVCTDVLEHIEPEFLDDVLDDLQRLTRKVLFIQVANVGAKHTLPDGRNAHLVVRPARWWVHQLWDRFNLRYISTTSVDFEGVFTALNPAGNGSK